MIFVNISIYNYIFVNISYNIYCGVGGGGGGGGGGNTAKKRCHTLFYNEHATCL